MNKGEEEKIPEAISDYNNPQSVPGMNSLEDRVRRFHDCVDAMMVKNREIEDDGLFAVAVLEDVANGCREMGLEEDFGVRMAGFLHVFDPCRATIKSVFQTAYLKEQIKTIPLKYLTKSALLMFKTEAYMNEHYVLRFNIMTGVPEYKNRGLQYSFADLDDRVRNTMTSRALKAGVESWDKDLDRYIDSDEIPLYNPMQDYLQHLPRWDGKDRVGKLARRVQTTNKYWEHDFHIWMLSMVAQWRNINAKHGNAIVPLLVGPPGGGKSSFCRILLPESLQKYYNDKLSMKNENDINIAMSSYALINIDEFDGMLKSHQPILKYLLSKHDVKMRPPYGKVVERRQRFASFIATTNNSHPLTDPTGSRRFICIYTEKVEYKKKINHDQIFAQLLHELRSGARYWFDDKDNQRIIRSNADFQQVKDFPTMIDQLFLSPDQTPADAPMKSVSEIMGIIAKRYSDVSVTNGAHVVLGRALSEKGYEKSRHKDRGILYRILAK